MKWVHFLHRDMSVLFEYCAQRGASDYTVEMLGLPGISLRGRKIDNGHIYQDANELITLRKAVEAGGQEYLNFLAEACFAQCEQLIQTSVECSNLAPHEALGIYFEEQYRLMPFLPLFPAAIDPLITAQFEGLINKYATERYLPEMLAETFARPEEEFAIQKEKEERYKIGAYVQQNSPLNAAFLEGDETAQALLQSDEELLEMMSTYIADYGWVETRHFKGVPWTLEDAFERVRDSLNENCSEKYNELIESHRLAEKNISETCVVLNISVEDKIALQTIRRFIFLRTQRKDVMSQAWHLMRKVVGEVGLQAQIDPEDMSTLLPEEILELAKYPEKGLSFIQSIADRKEGFTLITYDGETRLFAGGEKESRFESGTTTTLHEVRGISIVQGEVDANGRRIMDKEQIETTKDGEIIIAPMTSPDFVVIMDRAKGIITDEGGITCHAAHLSREHKIPCIVGTETATKVFDTGDRVYLNATEGFARKESL